jgi:hypothetical protein
LHASESREALTLGGWNPRWGTLGGLIKSALVALFGVVCFLDLEGPAVLREMARPVYASTHGTLDAVIARENKGTWGSTWTPRVLYSFSVGGKTYFGGHLTEHLLDASAFDRPSQGAAEDQFTIGSDVEVRYDPSNPDRNYVVLPWMRTQYWTRTEYWLVMAICGTAVVIFFRNLQLFAASIAQKRRDRLAASSVPFEGAEEKPPR